MPVVPAPPLALLLSAALAVGFFVQPILCEVAAEARMMPPLARLWSQPLVPAPYVPASIACDGGSTNRFATMDSGGNVWGVDTVTGALAYNITTVVGLQQIIAFPNLSVFVAVELELGAWAIHSGNGSRVWAASLPPFLTGVAGFVSNRTFGGLIQQQDTTFAIACYCALTGTQLWTNTAFGSMVKPILVDDSIEAAFSAGGSIGYLVSMSNALVYAVQLETGQTLWSNYLINAVVGVGFGWAVAVDSLNAHFHIVDAANGTTNATISPQHTLNALAGAHARAYFLNSTALVLTIDNGGTNNGNNNTEDGGAVIALVNVTTGEAIWIESTWNVTELSTSGITNVTATEDLLIASAYGSAFGFTNTSFNMTVWNRTTGQRLWNASFPSLNDATMDPTLFVDGDVIYVLHTGPTAGGGYRAISARTGATIAAVPFEPTFAAGGACVMNNDRKRNAKTQVASTILVAQTTDGTVSGYAFLALEDSDTSG